MLAGLDSWQDCDSGFNCSRQNIDDHSKAAFIVEQTSTLLLASTPTGSGSAGPMTPVAPAMFVLHKFRGISDVYTEAGTLAYTAESITPTNPAALPSTATNSTC